MSLQGIASAASTRIRAMTGVFVPPSVILQHFAAENSVSPSAKNNYAGLMAPGAGGGLLSFNKGSQFVNAYTENYVVPNIQGAMKQGAIKRGQTLTAGQYAAALQYGGPYPYCSTGCGSFYQAAGQNAQGYNQSHVATVQQVNGYLASGVPQALNPANLLNPGGGALTSATAAAGATKNWFAQYWPAILLGLLALLTFSALAFKSIK
ncbi:MAG: hypothetical protein ACYCT2_09020 [Thermoplasmataceae archaeon]